jgi:hypothetical protein
MERSKTRPATDLVRLVLGIVFVIGGLTYGFTVHASTLTRKIAAATVAAGFFMLVLSRLGFACVACGRALKTRKYGFAPSVEGPLRAAAAGNDVAAMAGIVRGPRIDDQTKDRTSLVVGYCDRCKRVATIEAVNIRGGRHAGEIADREVTGDGVEPLIEAAIETPP